MTALSPRLAPAAIALLLASSLPVWLHAIAAPTRDPCVDPRSFFEARRIGGAASVDPTAGFDFGHNAVEVRSGVGTPVLLSARVVQSFDASRFVSRPIAFAFDPLLHLADREARTLDAGGEQLPVHWFSQERQNLVRVEAYVYARGLRAVRHPLPSGFGEPLETLARGPEPITLLIASAVADRRHAEELDAAVEAWLVAAWEQRARTCRP